MQPADGEELGRRGKIGHHQRHLSGPQRFLGGPEAFGRLVGPREDQAPGIEEGAHPVPERPLAGAAGLEPEHGAGEPGGGEEGEDRARRSCRLVRAGARQRDAGGEREFAGVRGAAGLEHVRAMFARNPREIKASGEDPRLLLGELLGGQDAGGVQLGELLQPGDAPPR